MNRNACLDYRTSRPKNGSYMTPDDFKRYFAACRRVSVQTEAALSSEPSFLVEKQGVCSVMSGLTPRGSDAKNECGTEKTALLPWAGSANPTGFADRLGRAGKLVAAIEKKLGEKDIINKTIRLADEWIAVDSKEYRAEGAQKKIPYQTMLMILALSLLLLLIVSGSVITSKAKMELGALENRLGELEEYKEELEQKLEIKNDLKYIEEVARTKLGMIDKNYAPLRYLGSEPEEKVVIYDTGTDNGRVGLSTLLSALGFPD